MKIGFLPIDNRPVCYSLPGQIAAIDGDIELLLPPKQWLGSLDRPADVDKIFEWLENLPDADAFVISLDTAAYGGLIPSRTCPHTFEQIKARIEKFKSILEQKRSKTEQKRPKIYAFSSIMRISDNNFNQEEKEYWSKWGKKLFNWSYYADKYGRPSETDIPAEVLNDYIQSRTRNFEINKIYLEWQKQGFFDTLVFSKDDCAEFGLNVQEARALEALGGFVKTGADEIPLALLARALDSGVKIAPVFLEPECKGLISNYEDVSIEQSVLGQIRLAGCIAVDAAEADILLYVNNFKERQGEIVMGVETAQFDGIWEPPAMPYMAADVRFANGADNRFVEQLLKTPLTADFFGYAAWNTSANTLGSLICAAKTKFLARKYNDNAFKRLQIVRFLDDWAYQANVRQTNPDISSIKERMKAFEDIVFQSIGLSECLSYNFPWTRLFEVEIEFN